MLKGYTWAAIAVLAGTGFISTYFSYNEKMMLMEQMDSGADDLNREVLRDIISEYDNGLTYLLRFLTNGDLYYFYVTAAVIFAGLFMSSEMLREKDNNYGNFCVARQGYGNLLRNSCGGMILCISIVVMISTVLIFTGDMIFAGYRHCIFSFGRYQISFGQGILIALGSVIFLMIFLALMMIISVSVSMFIKNLILARLFPVLAFILIPVVMGSTLANVFPATGQFFCRFIPLEYLGTVTDLLYYSSENQKISVICAGAAISMLTVIAVSAAYLNKKRFSRDYI